MRAPARVSTGPPSGGLVAGALLVVATLAGCASTTVGLDGSPIRLRYIGERTFDHRLQFGGTTVGGLSGIDYDPRDDLYYVISDDRSLFSPARFYTAKLTFDADGFTDASPMTVVTLRTPEGKAFSPWSGREIADGEAIRFDPRTRRLWWTSEGERTVTPDHRGDRLVDPFVREAALDGRYVASLPLPAMFRMDAGSRGPRDNRTFEGLSFSIDAGSLYVAMEGPLLQDGPMPTFEHGAWSRISRHDRDPDGGFGPVAAQFAYPIDPIPDVFAVTQAKALNSVSEILAFDDHRLLVLERALVLGSGWRVRLYLADLTDATDVRALDTLAAADNALPFTPMTKRLVLDFHALPPLIDNLEGMCFGPMLANGHRSLVLVSDDNFNPGEKTQFLVFDVATP